MAERVQGKKRSLKRKQLVLLSFSLLLIASLSSSITATVAFFNAASFASLKDIPVTVLKPAEVTIAFSENGTQYEEVTNEVMKKEFGAEYTQSSDESDPLEYKFYPVTSAFSYRWQVGADYKTAEPSFGSIYRHNTFTDSKGKQTPMYVAKRDADKSHYLQMNLYLTEKAQESLGVNLYLGSNTTFTVDQAGDESEQAVYDALAQSMRISILTEDTYYIVNPYKAEEHKTYLCGPMDFTSDDAWQGDYLDTYPSGFLRDFYKGEEKYKNREALYGEFQVMVPDENGSLVYNETDGTFVKAEEDGTGTRYSVINPNTYFADRHDPLQYLAWSDEPVLEDTENSYNGITYGTTRKGNYAFSFEKTLAENAERFKKGWTGVRLCTENEEGTYVPLSELMYKKGSDGNVPLVSLTPGETKRIVVTYYLEGWDHNNLQAEGYGAFLSTFGLEGEYTDYRNA